MLDAPCLVQKTGEQLLTLAKQLVFHGCGIIPTREWYMVPARHQQADSAVPPQGGPGLLGEVGRLLVEEAVHR